MLPLNASSDNPLHQRSSFNHDPLCTLRQKRPRINKTESHLLLKIRKRRRSYSTWGFRRPRYMNSSRRMSNIELGTRELTKRGEDMRLWEGHRHPLRRRWQIVVKLRRRDFPGAAPGDNARSWRGETKVIFRVVSEGGEAWNFVAGCRPSGQRVNDQAITGSWSGITSEARRSRREAAPPD